MATAPETRTPTTKSKKAQLDKTSPSEDTSMSDIEVEDSIEGDHNT